MNVIIFGAGVSGLTVAHELLDKGFNVSIYEKNNSVGGFARSKRREDGMPTEHALRVYGIHYENLLNILKRIPIDSNYVYDNLDRPRKNINLHDKLKVSGNSQSALYDNMIIAYYVMKSLFSNLRNKEYSKISVKTLFHKKLSPEGYNKYAGLINFLNLNPESFSLYDSAKYIHDTMLRYHYHARRDKKGIHEYKSWFSKITDNKYFMNQPTSEAWLDIWVKYLQTKGLKLYLNSSLKNIQMNAEGKIERCLVEASNGSSNIQSNFSESSNIQSNKWTGASSDIFVICINPFEFQKILTDSGLLKIPWVQKTELIKFPYLTNQPTHDQIGFTLILNSDVSGLNKEIQCPSEDHICSYTLNDSEFGIAFYVQSDIFKNDPYITKLQKKYNQKISVISGITTNPMRIGKLYGKTLNQLNREQIMKEIIYQIFRSEEFNNFQVLDSNIWHEWNYDFLQNKLISNSPKWMTNMENLQYRPDQKSGISNLYIGGAHTKTTTHFWNMEGATESGKLVANHIIDYHNDKSKEKSFIYSHEPLIYFEPFKFLDDILYTLCLPNILDFLLIIIVIAVLSYFIKFNLLFKNKKSAYI